MLHCHDLAPKILLYVPIASWCVSIATVFVLSLVRGSGCCNDIHCKELEADSISSQDLFIPAVFPVQH